MISPMALVEIAGPFSVFEDAVDAIQGAGLMHILEIPLAESRTHRTLHRVHLSGAQQREMQTYEEVARSMEEVVSQMPPSLLEGGREIPGWRAEYVEWAEKPVGLIAVGARKHHARARSFTRRRRNIEDDIQVLEGHEKVVTAVAELVDARSQRPDFQFLAVILERGRQDVSNLLQEELRQHTSGEYSFSTASVSDGQTAALIGFHQHYADEVRGLLADVDILEWHGPRHLRKEPFLEAVSRAVGELDDLRRRREELLVEIDDFYRENGAALAALERLAKDRLSRLRVVTKMVRTEHVFFTKGWVPRGRVSELAAALREAVGEHVVVRPLKDHGAGVPPVQLHNREVARPFELLLGLLPMPKYGTVDPTMSLAIFFPPMFGLMLGDVGYGLLLAIIAVYAYFGKGASKLRKEVGVVLGHCAFYSTAFGFFFGELFGPFGHSIGMRPLWRERLSLHGVDKKETLLGYLGLCLAVGLIHIVLGLVLGIINGHRAGERGHVYNCAARIGGLFGLLFLGGWLTHFLPPVFFTMGIICLLAFAVLMWVQCMHEPLHGLMLPLELLSTVGNILSYARIMAVGLASVVLAVLANHFGGMISNLALAAIVVVLMHALVLGIGIADSSIQGIRLQYVEFFSKFYQTGGIPYEPFRKAGGALD